MKTMQEGGAKMLNICLASCSVAPAYCGTSFTNRERETGGNLQICIILHSTLVRLRMGGELNDEKNEDGNLLRPGQVVEEFYYNAVADNCGEILGEEGAVAFENSSLSQLLTLLGVEESIRTRQMHAKLKEALTAHISEHVGISAGSLV